MKYDLRLFKKISEELIEKFGDLGFDLELDEIKDNPPHTGPSNGDLIRKATVPYGVPFPGMTLNLEGSLWLMRDAQRIKLRMHPIARTERGNSLNMASSYPELHVDHVDGKWDEFVWR
jgi:hypothetical protein